MRQSMMPISSLRRGSAAGEQDLAAGLLRRLEQHDVVAARGGDARRFQAAGAGADDHHFAARAGRCA